MPVSRLVVVFTAANYADLRWSDLVKQVCRLTTNYAPTIGSVKVFGGMGVGNFDFCSDQRVALKGLDKGE